MLAGIEVLVSLLMTYLSIYFYKLGINFVRILNGKDARMCKFYFLFGFVVIGQLYFIIQMPVFYIYTALNQSDEMICSDAFIAFLHFSETFFYAMMPILALFFLFVIY